MHTFVNNIDECFKIAVFFFVAVEFSSKFAIDLTLRI